MISMTRAWAMPSGDTFSIKPIHDFIAHRFFISPAAIKVADPFCRNSPFKDACISNDIDPSIEADYHMDALDFLGEIESGSLDGVLFDPPYSPRQVSECYKKMDRTVNMQTTQASFWSKLKAEVGRTVRVGGKVVTCGWNSGGIGQKYGFRITDIMLVAHGGWHNDTIVTMEVKVEQEAGE